jgi:hypothetical protein
MAGTTTTPEENALQEQVAAVNNSATNLQALTSLRSHVVSMVNRATAAFVFSIIGAAYQMISLYVAVLIDRNTSPFFYFTVGYYTLFLTGFIVIWSASHILEDWKGRITWPSIILVLGIANLASVVMSDYAQTSPIQGSTTSPSITMITAIVSGPLLIVIGGILGFSAVRQYSREHGRAVLGHA